MQPFTAIFYCERHRCNLPHVVQFMNYDTKTNAVSFLATCEECEEEAEENEDIIGFTASLPAPEWDKITPGEDNPSFN